MDVMEKDRIEKYYAQVAAVDKQTRENQEDIKEAFERQSCLARFLNTNLPVATFNMVTDTLHKMLGDHHNTLWNELVDVSNTKYD
jgi:hypothetical protein